MGTCVLPPILNDIKAVHHVSLSLVRHHMMYCAEPFTSLMTVVCSGVLFLSCAAAYRRLLVTSLLQK